MTAATASGLPIQLTLLRYPTGRWGFAGRVPLPLAYEHRDGSPATDAEIRDDLRLPGNVRKLRSVAFETREEAVTAAAALGYEVA